MTELAPASTESVLDERKAAARAWFESLRDRIVKAFELLEDEAPPVRRLSPAW